MGQPLHARDPGWFEHLYRRNRAAVYRFLRRDLPAEDAEDATQTAFLQAYSAYMRGGRPAHPSSWLFAIADNLRRRRFATQQRRPREVPFDEVDEPSVEPNTLAADELQGAIERLPVNQRAVFVLRELGGLSYAEIAEQMRTSVNGVQMLLFRARRTLREELEGTRSRVASFPVPAWLLQMLGWGDRIALPARAAGVAAAAAVAAVVATAGGAAPPPAVPQAHEPTARMITEPTKPTRSRGVPTRRPTSRPTLLPQVSTPERGEAGAADAAVQESVVVQPPKAPPAPSREPGPAPAPPPPVLPPLPAAPDLPTELVPPLVAPELPPLPIPAPPVPLPATPLP